MKPAAKRKWVKELASGKHEQGKGVLKDSRNRYCCLGVLGDTYDPISPAALSWALLPDAYAERVGLTFQHQCELAGLNDIGVPFEMIAGFIRENI